MRAHTLLQFAEVLGIEAQQVKEHETQQRLLLSVPVPVRKLRVLTSELVEALATGFGTALELTVGVAGAEPLLHVGRGLAALDIRSALAEISALAGDMNLEVTVQVDKAQITEQLRRGLDGYHVLFYLFLENVLKLFRAPLPQLDTLLFSGDHMASVVVVSDSDIECKGPLLSVIDAERLRAGGLPSAPPGRRLQRRLDRLRAIASDNLTWLGFRLANLTPLHTMCDCQGPQGNEIRHVLGNRTLEIMMVYTANRSSMDERRITAVYASPEQSARVVIRETPLATELQRDIARLAVWLDGPGQADKLAIFQTVVAREITGEDLERNLTLFVEMLPHLLNEARWHYRVVVEGRISKHFEKVEAAGSHIAHTTEEIAKTLDSTTKGFVDALLATVGVVILTLLASLVEGKTQGLIFTVGMWAYAIYLFVFQLVYRMGHLYRSYNLIVAESEHRILPFRIVLGKKKTSDLTEVLEKRKRYFVKMYWITVVLYILVILSVLALGAALPSAIVQPGAAAPTPTLANPA